MHLLRNQKKLTLSRLVGGASLCASRPCIFDTETNDLDLDILMNADMQMTSALKRPQKISHTALPVYVLSNHNILNSGMDSIPEALELSPQAFNAQLRQLAKSQWEITAMFSGGFYSRKHLIIEGQNVDNTEHRFKDNQY